MKKKRKKRTACALVAVIGLSFAVYPVHAEEVPTTEQTDTEELLELEETDVPMEESTETEATPESKTGETETISEEQAEKNIDIPIMKANVGQPIDNNIQPYAENNAGAFNVTGGSAGTDWTYDAGGHVLTIQNNGTYTISQNTSDAATADYIEVEDNFSGSITIQNLNINGAYGIEAISPSNLTLYLDGTNSIKASESPAIHYSGNENSRLEITSKTNGTLKAETTSRGGGNPNADIGGDWAEELYNLYISGGNITTPNRIGSGNHVDGITLRSIYITGGNVKTPYIGVGMSDYGNCQGGTIDISGGSISANGIGTYVSWGLSTTQGAEKIIVTGGSIKCSTFEVPPVDKSDKPVYQAVLNNQTNIGSIQVDDNPYPIGNNHDNDSAFYLYLTGEDHTIMTNTGTYYAVWNGSDFDIKQSAPTPTVTIASKTANSITVNELAEKKKYGGAEYSLDNQNWQESNSFTNLHSFGYGGTYTVYARYKGNDSYSQSQVGILENVSTNEVSYTITIPNSPLEAGKEGSASEISVEQTQSFDLGYNGHVDVKIKNNSNNVTADAKLKLKRITGTQKEITSALRVNGVALGNINKSVATFTMNNQTPVSVSFAQPTGIIPAGDYSGTITFEVSYSEGGQK